MHEYLCVTRYSWEQTVLCKTELESRVFLSQTVKTKKHKWTEIKGIIDCFTADHAWCIFLCLRWHYALFKNLNKRCWLMCNPFITEFGTAGTAGMLWTYKCGMDCNGLHWVQWHLQYRSGTSHSTPAWCFKSATSRIDCARKLPVPCVNAQADTKPPP